MIEPIAEVAAWGAAAAGAVAGAYGVYISPQLSRASAVAELDRVCRARRLAVLTFDDGPGRTITPRILELLGSAGAKATFFLLGWRAREAPEVVDQVVAAGHEVGCHTRGHLNAWRSSPWRTKADIEDGYSDLGKWVPASGMFRPPFGRMNMASMLVLNRRGARTGWWTIDSGDLQRPMPGPSHAADELARRGGGVVLLHDYERRDPNRAAFVIAATELLVARAAAEGLSMCTLGEAMNGGAA